MSGNAQPILFTEDNNKRILSLLGNEMANTLTNVFDAMEIAQEVISKKQKQYPQKKSLIYNAFNMLCISDSLIRTTIGKWKKLYKLHCQELIDRQVENLDTSKATKAEILISIMDMSLLQPLRYDCMTYAQRLFLELLPDEAFAMDIDNSFLRESCEDSHRDIYNEFYDKLKTGR